MCGIVGAVGERDVVPVLMEGLRRLEYRGYDSAGVAVVDERARLERRRTSGKVSRLSGMLDAAPLRGTIGIAHTRWATHGVPSERNAHPHVSREAIAVVHNGIIENHEGLRRQLVDPRLRVCLRHRYRSHCQAHRSLHGRRPGSRGSGMRRDPHAQRCVRDRCYRRGTSRPYHRSPARMPARDRARRRRALHRFRCRGAHTGNPALRSPRGWRRGGCPPRQGVGDRPRREAGCPSGRGEQGFRRCGRARPVPALHAEGDLRAAGCDFRHPRRQAWRAAGPRSGLRT